MKGAAGRAFPPLTSLLLTAIVLECSLRALGPFLPGTYRTGPLIEPDPTLGWRNIPSTVTWFRQPEFVARAETNAEGRFGPLVRKDRPEQRVLVLGDSFVGATQIPYERSLTAVLQRELGRTRDVEVINAGVSGYGTDQEVLSLEVHGPALSPDVVVLVFTVANDVWNDHYPFESQRPTYQKPYFVADGEGLRLIEPAPAERTLAERIRPVLGRSALLTAIKTGIIDRIVGGGVTEPAFRRRLLDVLRPPEGEWASAWDMVHRLVVRFGAKARAIGARPVLAIAPDPCQVHADLCDGDAELSTSSIPQAQLAAAAHAAGVMLIDMSPRFRESAARGRLYFPIDLHWTPEGHDLAAQILADALVGMSPPRP